MAMTETSICDFNQRKSLHPVIRIESTTLGETKLCILLNLLLTKTYHYSIINRL